MRTRILLLVSAFAFALIPACKKPVPTPTPEQVARAEQEIKAAARKVCVTTLNLEGTDGAGMAISLKEKLDGLKADLAAIRERNKDIVSMERSKELTEEAFEETKQDREKIKQEVKKRYQE
jgi:uncharacterized protein YicC (UPF0701 family)